LVFYNEPLFIQKQGGEKMYYLFDAIPGPVRWIGEDRQQQYCKNNNIPRLLKIVLWMRSTLYEIYANFTGNK